jgi:hypothetical protein
MKKIHRNLFLGALVGLICGCQQREPRQDTDFDQEKAKLTEESARRIFEMPLHCLTVEYPNKLGQAIGSDEDLKPPRVLRPIFYGCYDWHSSVHGYWSVVKLLKAYPSLDADGKVVALLNQHLTERNGEIEKAFFEDKNNLGFERTYGWAWLFKLQEELHTWEHPDARRWESVLQPLVTLLADRLVNYLPNLVYPVRHGKHENTAFGLSLMLDYARTVRNAWLEESIVSHSIRLFQNDRQCDLAYEPSGSDFLSPCLEEAYLMSKVLTESEFKAWVSTFLPSLTEKDFNLEPAVVRDRTDGQLIHLDGLNYSRAACLYGIAERLEGASHLIKIANDHMAFALPNLSKEDDYMGSHWLGTFALYALTN